MKTVYYFNQNAAPTILMNIFLRRQQARIPGYSKLTTGVLLLSSYCYVDVCDNTKGGGKKVELKSGHQFVSSVSSGGGTSGITVVISCRTILSPEEGAKDVLIILFCLWLIRQLTL